MSRMESYSKILEAAAKFHFNIAMILEAKAIEAEKSRKWICNHMTIAAVPKHDDQVKQSIEVHDQLLELIDGITKMENALGRNLQVILAQDESSEESSADYSSLMTGKGGSIFNMDGLMK